MESSGLTLGEIAKGKFFRGVVTGLNDAFYLDRDGRRSLIEKDSRSEFLIKDALRGGDVRRYESHSRGLYLIRVPCGLSLSLLGYDSDNATGSKKVARASISETKAWKAFRSEFAAVADHLKRFETKARQRDDQGDYWWELRPCDYYAAFEETKITFPQTAKESRFMLDQHGNDLDQTAYMLSSGDWFLLGLLNSSSVESYFRGISSTVRGGYLRFLTQYLENLPVPNTGSSDREWVAKMARRTHELHSTRRKRVENFLRAIGTDPTESTSRNPLERPWALSAEEFSRRARNQSLKKFTDARDETLALTEQITIIEREIDERVAALYGVPLEPNKAPVITGVDPGGPFRVEASPDAAAEADETKAAASHWDRGRAGSPAGQPRWGARPARNERTSAKGSSQAIKKEQRRSSRSAVRARGPRFQQCDEGQRKIGDYSRDELIAVLLKGIGKKWWTRDDAIRAASNRLGFRRTGSQIRDAFKSAITGAIRRGLMEYDGDYIRRSR